MKSEKKQDPQARNIRKSRSTVFRQGFVAQEGRKVGLLKRVAERSGHGRPKFAPRCGKRAIWKSKRKRRLQLWWIWRGSARMRLAWQVQGFLHLGGWCWCVEWAQFCCSGNVSFQLSFRAAANGLRMPRLLFLVAGAILWSNHFEIAKTWWNADDKCGFDISVSKEAKQKTLLLTLPFPFWREISRENFVFMCRTVRLAFLKDASRNASFLGRSVSQSTKWNS